MSDWHESTEGDLDPDLTEEADYSGWEPPRRAWWPVAFQVLGLVAIASVLGTVVIAAIR